MKTFLFLLAVAFSMQVFGQEIVVSTVLERLQKLQQSFDDQKKEIDQLKNQIDQLKSQIQLKDATSETIKIGGDLNHYYPVFFRDHGWEHGAFTVQICRSSAHHDSVWQGSLMSTFTSHSSGWGNGSDFVIADIHNGGKSRHIASYHATYYALGIVVWLRGASTYFYRTNHPTEVKFGEEIITYTNEDHKVCEKFVVMDAIEPFVIEGYQYHGRIRLQELQTQELFLHRDGKDFKIFKTEAGISLQDMTTEKVYKFVLEEVK